MMKEYTHLYQNVITIIILKTIELDLKKKIKEKILSDEKTITIRNKSEAHFKKGDLLEIVNPDGQYLC